MLNNILDLVVLCPKFFELKWAKRVVGVFYTKLSALHERTDWFSFVSTFLHGCCKLSHDCSCLTPLCPSERLCLCQSAFYGSIIQGPYLQYIILTRFDLDVTS